MLARLVLCFLLSVAAAAGQCGTLVVTTAGNRLAGGLNQGWWSDGTDAFDANDNYITGTYPDHEYRSFFSFDLTELRIAALTRATLSLRRFSMSGPVDLHLWDVSSDPVRVNHNVGRDKGIFADLGSGTGYGSLHVALSDFGAVVIDLNAAGLDALKHASGYFTIGASATGGNFIFGSSEGYPVSLILEGQIAVVPEPASAAMLLAGLALLAYFGRGLGSAVRAAPQCRGSSPPFGSAPSMRRLRWANCSPPNIMYTSGRTIFGRYHAGRQ